MSIQAVKALVIGLGVLIILSFGLLIYGFMTKLAGGGADEVPAAATGAPVAGFGQARVPLPDECTVVDVHPDGERIYLRTGPAGVCERLIVLDASTGNHLGTIAIRP